MAERRLDTEADTVRLGQDLAAAARAGDVFALQGDLGAGKTCLARAFLRALHDDPELEVPSPTFTLVQDYSGRLPVSHFDLYRLGSADELDELGFSEAVSRGAVLVEWPERAQASLPPDALWVRLEHAPGSGRLARLEGVGALAERARRSLGARDFLLRHGWGDAFRAPLTGDASARSYDLLRQDGAPPRLLMNAPPLVLGPPVREGRAYAEIAHTARSVDAFVALDDVLRAQGFAAPEIFAQDLENGFLVVEHLGGEGLLDAEGRPIPERYEAAGQLLAELHRRRWTPLIKKGTGVTHRVPPFDRDALAVEAELLLDWYVPFASGQPASDALRAEFAALWEPLFETLGRSEQSLLLRDYHSPNIIWRGERKGLDRLGLIDFQDALIGPAAYDVASLAMDARVTVSPELRDRVVRAYEAARAGDPSFNSEAFREAFATAAAQRNSKILGIFVRLARRDGKEGYLKHLPRIRAYLAAALEHPSLAALKAFYLRHGFIGADA
ncbi:MAG TPA: tRNA (adenosine(37)-N6)-threonylcarbamoyltransferase complex ATPase subunit type 1 TsaE [Mesorhizobium sp.]|jgi:hypothetical protein|nr:tRNA (adenosine(37)-N6)-threonylcarbamoyltransferase complex ATPase subunit type 1 TsaE [Mesorhizobium sp.]